MSNLRVDTITSVNGTDPVNFPTGISGDASGLSFDPKIVNFSPNSLQTGVSVGTNIVFTFDQNIQFSGSGTIELRSGSSTGTIVESYVCGSSSRLTISGQQLIIDPTNSLSFNTTYFVVIPSSGIGNSTGSLFAGTSSYSFQTVASEFQMSGGSYEFIQQSPESPTGYYKYHLFTGTSPFTLTSSTPNATDFTYLLIGGGGGGGAYPGSYWGGGGGGAGGLLTGTGPAMALSAGEYIMTIGAGGDGSTPTTPSNTNGGDTYITPPSSPTSYVLRAVGGGAGGYPANSNPPYIGNPGGSGGGSYSSARPPTGLNATGGLGTPGQGNPGGGNTWYHPTGYSMVGGGGGGAGSAGSQAYADNSYGSSNYWWGGPGGDGTSVPQFPMTIFSPGFIPESDFPADSINRSGGVYAGGGGGGCHQYQSSWAGRGGPGGGGHGGGPTGWALPGSTSPNPPGADPTNYAQHGASKLGSGGGGGGSRPSYGGGNGGSGVAMIRYAVPVNLI